MKSIKLVALFLATALSLQVPTLTLAQPTAETQPRTQNQQRTEPQPLAHPQSPLLLKGRILDAATGEPEPYVTYSIASTQAPEGAEPLKMTITAEDGTFSETLPEGSYTITFTSMGKKPLTIEFTTPADLGDILMEDDSQALQGASVTALSKLVKMDVDKMTYKVEEDVDSKTMTMLDILRKVPMVTVDAQDNITVNGSSSFKVYVDGKPNAMLSSNPSQIFKMMPASAFKSVEVITNPGAKYDAEGVGGVLNLITDKSSGQKAIQDGFNATVRTETDTKGDIGGGVFATGQKGKFSISANVNVSSNKNDGITMSTSLQNLGSDGSVLTDLTSEGNTSQRAPGVFSDISASYEIDSLRLLTASFGVMDFNTSEQSAMTSTMTAAGSTLFSYDTDSDASYRWASYRAGLDYQRSFAGVEGRALTASYLFSTRPNRNNTYMSYNGYADDRHSDSKENMVEQTAQLDYTTPLGTGQTLSTGAKFISRSNASDSRYYLMQGGSWVPDAASSVDFSHLNSILGAYGEYSIAREKWSGKAGLRYEHTFQQVRYNSGAGSDFNLDYGNFVPSVSLQYNLGMMSNIGLSYNLRISRPGIGYLNPYINRSNVYSISYGNVDLETEKSHNIGLVWNFFTPVVMLNLTGRYSFCNNGISSYSFFDSDGVLNTTYGNIERRSNIGANAFINVNLGKKTRIYSNLGTGYVKLSCEERGLSNGGWQFYTFTGLQQTLPWDLRLSLNYVYNSRNYQLDGWTGGFSAIMGGITKSFLEDRLSVSIQGASGIGHRGNLIISSDTRGSDYRSAFTTTVPMPRVGISLSYRFGSAQNIQVRKTKRSISNDDVMQKSSGATNTGTSAGSSAGASMSSGN